MDAIQREKIYVAVGNDAQDGFNTLNWALKKWNSHPISIVILHVTHNIPNDYVHTPFGKLPARSVSDEKLQILRKDEQEKINKLLSKYIAFCGKVPAEIVEVEKFDEPMQKRVIDLIFGLGISKLVIGFSFMKPSLKSKGAISGLFYVHQHKPSFCELFIICGGKQVFLKGKNDEKIMEDDHGVMVARTRDKITFKEWLDKLFNDKTNDSNDRSASSLSSTNLESPENQNQWEFYLQEIENYYQELLSSKLEEGSCVPDNDDSQIGPIEPHVAEHNNSNMSGAEKIEFLKNKLNEAQNTIQLKRKEAKDNRDRHAKAEWAICLCNSRASELENQIREEVRAREELKKETDAEKEQTEELKTEVEEKKRRLRSLTEVQSELSNRLQIWTAAKARAEAQLSRGVGERQEMVREIENLRSHRDVLNRRIEFCKHKDAIGMAARLADDTCCSFREYTEEELRLATDNFSERLRLKSGGDWTDVYRGRFNHSTVAIKMIPSLSHHHFQSKVRLLGDIRQPHLVAMVGFCSEPKCIILEYMRNGSLRDMLFSRRKNRALRWHDRIRIATEVCSGLGFLNGANPRPVFHCHLTPSKVLLDGNLVAKITTYGLHECHDEQCNVESDLRAIGVLLMHLLTGRNWAGLVEEVMTVDMDREALGAMEDDYNNILSEEINMDLDIGVGVSFIEDPIMDIVENEVDCSDAFQTTEVFPTRDDVLKWARAIGFELGFDIVISRSDTFTGERGRSTYAILGCERGGKYRAYKKDVVPKPTGSRKCGCPFKLKAKPMQNGEGWIVKLCCGIHNHELGKSMVGHPYAGRLTGEEKSILADMTKSMVKPKSILLTLKEKNEKNVSTIKQVYNARCAYRSAIRGDSTEMQHLMKLLQRDMYIHWHRVNDENVIRDIFWIHPDAVKLVNACHIVFLIDSTYKTNRYRLPLLEIVGMTPTGLTFSAGFAYLESERFDNVVWALQRLKGLFLTVHAIPEVFVTDRDIALMNAVNTVFPEATNLLCSFHINKNVKAKCKMYVHPTEAWEHVMDAWGGIVECPSEYDYDDCIAKFDMVCSPWPLFIAYVKNTWLVPHKEKFVKAWTDKVMHLGNTTSNRVEAAHSSLKRLLRNSIGDLCNSWDAINNMIILQHTEIKASFEQSTHVVGHRFNGRLYKRLRGMVSKYALTHIADELDRVNSIGIDSSRCGCSLRVTYGLPCACELARYVVGSIPLDSVHMFWRRLSFAEVGVSDPEISVSQELEDISKRFHKIDMCGKVTMKAKLREIAYPEETSMCAPPDKVKTKGGQKRSERKAQRSTKREPSYFEYVDAMHSFNDSSTTQKVSQSSSQGRKQKRPITMLDQFHPNIHQYITDIVDVKADGNCGYRAIAALLGMGEESWPLVRNHLLKELSEWRDEYVMLVGGIERYEQLKRSLLVDGLTMTTMDKWMNITDLGYAIASRYNVVLVSLSLQQSMTFFPLRSQPPRDSSTHRMICIGHVHGNHFVQVFLKDRCPIPSTALLWSTHCYPQALNWPTAYISRMQQFTQLISVPRSYVSLTDD